MSSGTTTTLEHFGNAPDGQRRARRQRIGPLVYVGLGPCNGGFPINVSIDGLAFQGVRPLQKDESFPVKFKLPDLDNCVEASGQVIWVNQIGTGGGLRFVDLPEDSRLLIKNWISSENPSALIEEGLGSCLDETKADSSCVAAPEELPPDTCISIPTTEKGPAVESAPQNPPELLQKSSPNKAVQTEANRSAASKLIPLSSTISILAPVVPVPPVTNRRKSARLGRPMVLAIVGVAIITMAGLISLDFGQRALLERMRESIGHLSGSFTSVTPLPSPLGVKVGGPSGEQAEADHAISESDLNSDQQSAITSPVADVPVLENRKSQTQTAPKSEHAKIASPKRPTKQLTVNAFAKPFEPAKNVRPEAADLVAPTVALPARPQPAPSLSVVFPQPPSPATTELFPQGDRLEEARLLDHKDPVYPASAKAEHISGSVDLLFTIGVDGTVHNVKVINGNGLLARSAVETVKSWHFQPARRDGVAVAVESSTIINFRLK